MLHRDRTSQLLVRPVFSVPLLDGDCQQGMCGVIRLVYPANEYPLQSIVG